MTKDGLMNPPTIDALGKIWALVLGVKKVTPEDNFFALGGHSLLAVKLIAAVQDQFHIEDGLQLPDLFDYPTLAAFCEHLQSLMAPPGEWDEI